MGKEIIRTGMYVRFKEIVAPGDEKIRMKVLEDYGQDSDRCLVQVLDWKLPLGSTKIVLKTDLWAI